MRCSSRSGTAAHIDHVQITVAETLGVEGRAGYYDTAGALRDMVQNHMLQLLCLVAMEPPASAAANDRARREAEGAQGAAADRWAMPWRSSRCADTIAPARRTAARCRAISRNWDRRTSKTETFVAIKAEIENWRWAGVPFYLRTGKRLAVARLRDRGDLQAGAAFDLRHGRRSRGHRTAWCCACSPTKASNCG